MQLTLVQAEKERNPQSSTNQPCTTHISTTNFCILHFCIEGKMKLYLNSILNFISYFYQSISTKIKPELKRKYFKVWLQYKLQI